MASYWSVKLPPCAYPVHSANTVRLGIILTLPLVEQCKMTAQVHNNNNNNNNIVDHFFQAYEVIECM